MTSTVMSLLMVVLIAAAAAVGWKLGLTRLPG